MKTLSQIQEELKSLLPNGIDLTLNAIKAVLNTGTDKFNSVILLESSYRDNNQSLLMGLITSENANLEFNKIRQAILLFIDDLKETDLKSADNGLGTKPVDQYNGEVFYRIPEKMQVEVEVKCIIRVAYDKIVLMEGIEQKETDVIKDLRISDVMGVELIDPNETPHFKIRTFNDQVQRIEKDLYTEWIYYVKPLAIGIFPLLLKISVIEIRDGIERKRDVVLEETVEITTTIPPDGGETKLMPTGINFNAAALLAGEKRETSSAKPPQPANSAPETTAPKSRGGATLKKVLGAFGIVALLITASTALYTWLSKSYGSEMAYQFPDNNIKGWKDYLKKEPGGKYAELAQTRLDSAETAIWNAAISSNEIPEIEAYLKEFPDGKYSQIAKTMIEKVNVPVKEQLYYETQLFNDSLFILLKGGDKPYSLMFNQSGKNVKSVTSNDIGTVKIPVKALKPGDYELILQDAAGSFFIDTITISSSIVPKPSQSPGVSKKPVSAKKPKPQNPPAPKPTPSNTNDPKVNEPKPPVKVPDQKPLPATEPIVSMQNAFRLPAFVGCDKEKKEKEFKCTNNKLAKYLGERMKYPEIAIKKNVTGQCVVEFIVEKDGTIHDSKVIQKLGSGCDEEALRLVSLLPPFRPGLGKNGQPIRVKYRLPVLFKIQ